MIKFLHALLHNFLQDSLSLGYSNIVYCLSTA